MLMIECQTCHKKHFTEDGRDPDKQLVCACCPEDHHHGEAANRTGVVCRGIDIQVLPGSASLKIM